MKHDSEMADTTTTDRCDGRTNDLAMRTDFSSTVALDHGVKHDTDTDYNPFEHRNLQHPNSTVGSFLHLLKSSLGSGLLAMPVAFKNAGLLVGTLGTFLVAFIAAHCVHILVKTSHEACRVARRPFLDYAETCEQVFLHGPSPLRRHSKTVSKFVDYAMAGVCLGGTSVYVIFIASSLKDIFDFFIPERQLVVEIYCAIILVPLILVTQFRHLKFLVPFSVIANTLLLVTFGITCYYIFTDLPDIKERSYVTNVLHWPAFISTAIFAMEGINVVMPVENEMAEPRHFLGCPGVLNVTMTFVCILYALMGFCGYWKYGEEVLGSITLNLPQKDILAQVAKLFVALSVMLTYCLQMYAPMEIIWGRLKQRVAKQYDNISQICLRTFCVTMTVALAAAVPDLELLIGLVGAIFFSTLGILIPVVVETVHLWERNLGTCRWILCKNVVLLLFYLIVLISGCYSSVVQIVARFRGAQGV